MVAPRIVVLLLVSALGAALPACSSHPQGQACVDGTDAGLNGSLQSAILGNACGGLTGTVAEGQPCKTGEECAPACCACGSLASGKSASVAYCQAGVCVQGNDACCAFLVEQSQTPGPQRTCQ